MHKELAEGEKPGRCWNEECRSEQVQLLEQGYYICKICRTLLWEVVKGIWVTRVGS